MPIHRDIKTSPNSQCWSRDILIKQMWHALFTRFHHLTKILLFASSCLRRFRSVSSSSLVVRRTCLFTCSRDPSAGGNRTFRRSLLLGCRTLCRSTSRRRLETRLFSCSSREPSVVSVQQLLRFGLYNRSSSLSFLTSTQPTLYHCNNTFINVFVLSFEMKCTVGLIWCNNLIRNHNELNG